MIIHRIISGEEEPKVEDERDHMIELRALRNSHWIFVIGFMLAMGVLAYESPPSYMFAVLLMSGLIADAVGELSPIISYRRGF